MKDIHDVITHAKFGDDRLRGSGAVAGQISAFPIDFAGRPYNTLTLPCERVMFQRHSQCIQRSLPHVRIRSGCHVLPPNLGSRREIGPVYVCVICLCPKILFLTFS